MGKLFDALTPELAAWIAKSRVFFVATAPLDAAGLVNCSPKGLDTLRVLGEREIGYLDLTGSGIETVAHVRENGRIVFLFAAFEGAPRIVRLHGRATIVVPGTAAWDELAPRFPSLPGARAIVRATLTRISDSCGYGVPRMDYVGERDTLVRLAESRGEDGLARYRAEKNAASLDGLPGLASPSPDSAPRA